ncbi:hypothetical protein EJ06DRAFT_427365 [Trichodelitschia bisporula]|uniref:Uncharacterized protein n=1 Tax=Trichodelitschia bisporula TaxID=703511 RepID=A0A6G1HX17_9PEZI|nr:hypothetical protein EJ06DRAFT_427365 [Trichodelitschia bisporula]
MTSTIALTPHPKQHPPSPYTPLHSPNLSSTMSTVIDLLDSSPPGAADADAYSQRINVAGHCKTCKIRVASFYNSWKRITGSYYLPACEEYALDTSGLRVKGKPKAATADSAMSGCLIQPLACTKCNENLGILCTRASEAHPDYLNKRFFKLPRIQLKPADNPAGEPEVLPVVESAPASMDRERELLRRDGRDGADAPRGADEGRREEGAPQDVIKLRPAVHLNLRDTLVAESTSDREPPTRTYRRESSHRESTGHREPLHPNHRDAHPSKDRTVPLNGNSATNGYAQQHTYPSTAEVKLDAIDRIQTQVNLNRATLEACTRDIGRQDRTIQQLQQTFMQYVEDLHRQMRDLRDVVTQRAQIAPAPPAASSSVDDQTLEVFTSTLTNMSARVNEIDVLKMGMEVIKRRIKRVEDSLPTALAQTPTPQLPPPPPQQPDRLTPAPQPRLARAHYTPYPPSPPPPPASAPAAAAAAAAAAAGWATVNPAKRGPPLDTRGSDATTPLGSPKRAKLAPVEPRHSYEATERMEIDAPRASAGPGTNPNTPAEEPYSAASATGGSYVRYPTTPALAEDWPSSAPPFRTVSTPLPHPGEVPSSRSPPGRGRGSGSGRGRGRPPIRKGIDEWEREREWAAQQSDGGFGRGNLVRRGSSSMGMGMARGEGGSPPSGAEGSMAGDPYAHTKKTRTKPTRNAEGILIRKDGRPDMRSQSRA